MKLPREVKVLNHTYKVLEVDEIKPDLEHGDDAGDEILGLLDDTNLQILIIKNMNASRKAQVFLHEITHAVLNIIDVRRLLRDPEAEESIVNAISDILLQILSENQFHFEKTYPHDNIHDDMVIKNVLANHENGVDIASICESFQLETKEVKQIILNGKKNNKEKETKPKRKKSTVSTKRDK